MRIFDLTVLCLWGSLFASAQALLPDRPAGGSPQGENLSANSSAPRPSYRLGPGDQILIRAANAPDISEKPIRIDVNGVFSMPMIGRVEAAGLTVEQLQAEVAKRLKLYLEEPDVAVSVAEYQSQPVSVFGEVATPGVHQLQGRKTLVEILALSGGLKSEAGPWVRITRRIENGPVPLPGAKEDPTGRFSVAELELKPLMQAKSPDKDIEIEPYDIVSVPRAEYVYVAGDVNKSGALTLTDRPTMLIMEALSASGGTTKTSNARKSRILRAVPGSSRREQLPVDIAAIMSGKREDIELQAGDILFIPGSASKKATLRALEAAVQTGTAILTYGVIH
jgi:polysaccharide biosynthesis/export protein